MNKQKTPLTDALILNAYLSLEKGYDQQHASFTQMAETVLKCKQVVSAKKDEYLASKKEESSPEDMRFTLTDSIAKLKDKFVSDFEEMETKMKDLKEDKTLNEMVSQYEREASEANADEYGEITTVSSLKQFKIDKVLGKGAFGTVYLALFNGKKFAVKQIDKSAVINQMLEGDEARYITMRDREILVSKLVFDIPYCINFYSYFEEDGIENFVYELCTGGSLTSLLSKQPHKRLNEVQAKRILTHIAISINEMHKLRVVHRDIKPDNVMLSDESQNAIAKTVDFGTARQVNENNEFVAEKNETINQTVAGSGFYMSPEMRQELPNGTKTDVWSFAITIGVVFGLDELCSHNSNVPKFVKQCASGQFDMLLHKNGIHLSPIIKNLMAGMLMVDTKRRFTMQ